VVSRTHSRGTERSTRLSRHVIQAVVIRRRRIRSVEIRSDELEGERFAAGIVAAGAG
jgi:hypothetical protein